MVYLRRGNARGHSQLDWLSSRHTFSFGSYRDPAHNGFSVLRVLNEDVVNPGKGFASHSHHNMEIISHVREGCLEHKDSMENIRTLNAGEFQVMSAGTGVTHSEYNASRSRKVSFLQIWIQPAVQDVTPTYEQKAFAPRAGITPIVSPHADDGTLRIQQDAHLLRLILRHGAVDEYPLPAGRTAYIHVIEGRLDIEGHALRGGDGIGLPGDRVIHFSAGAASEALLFDLP